MTDSAFHWLTLLVAIGTPIATALVAFGGLRVTARVRAQDIEELKASMRDVTRRVEEIAIRFTERVSTVETELRTILKRKNN